MNANEKISSSNVEQRTSMRPATLDVVEQAKQVAGHVAEAAKGQVSSHFSDQISRAGESISDVASALRDTGRILRDKDPGITPMYVENAADRMDQLSKYLRRVDLKDVFDDVNRFARREPALFVGGAFLSGLIVGRFLKSSNRRSMSSPRGDWEQNRMQRDERSNESFYRTSPTYQEEMNVRVESQFPFEPTEPRDMGGTQVGSTSSNLSQGPQAPPEPFFKERSASKGGL